MTNIVVPEIVACQLQGLPHPVTLCNSSGKTLGCFMPAVDLSQYEFEGPEPTESELREAERSPKWYSTPEVLQHLDKLR